MSFLPKLHLNQFFQKYFWIISLVLFILLRLPSLFEPYWYGDEGIYLALGQGIRHGLELYSQIHDNKPPLLYFLAAFSRTVFGFRLLLALVMIPTLYYFYLLSQKFLNHFQIRLAFITFLVLTSIPLVEGSIANAEVFMLLPTIAAFYLFTRASDWRDYLYSGLLLGIAFALKVPVFVEIAFLILWILVTAKKLKTSIINILILGSASLIPLLIFGIYYYFQNSFSDFLFASLLNNFGYLSSWQTGSHTSNALSGGILVRTVVLFAVWATIVFLTLKKYFRPQYLFLLGWFAACVYAALLSGRPYPHYLIQVLPPLSILLSLLVYTKLKPTRYLILSSILVFSALLVSFKFYFYPVFSYYSNFTSYLLQITNYEKYASFFGDRVVTNQQISQYIKSNSSPSDRILVWGDEPYIYPLSDRLPAGRFLVAYHIVDFNRYDETMDDLIVNLPKFIVTYPMGNRPFPKLDDFIQKYYRPAQEIDNVIIFERR